MRLDRQWHVDSHLVTVKVGIERCADEGMQSNRFTLNQDRIERLKTKTMQCGRTIEHNGMLFDHLIQNIPDLRLFIFDQPFGAFNRRGRAALFKFVENKWLEKLQGHFFRQSALVQAQLRADDDDSPPGIINALP